MWPLTRKRSSTVSVRTAERTDKKQLDKPFETDRLNGWTDAIFFRTVKSNDWTDVLFCERLSPTSERMHFFRTPRIDWLDGRSKKKLLTLHETCRFSTFIKVKRLRFATCGRGRKKYISRSIQYLCVQELRTETFDTNNAAFAKPFCVRNENT